MTGRPRGRPRGRKGNAPRKLEDATGIIKQDYFYRKHSVETLKIVGVGVSSLEKAIRRNEFPAPTKLFPSLQKSPLGWWGSTLLKWRAEREHAA